jgi:hypothetical protein
VFEKKDKDMTLSLSELPLPSGFEQFSNHSVFWMLAAMLIMAGWHFIMFIWLYATRIPAMAAAKLKPTKMQREDLDNLPSWAQRPRQNYNHLAEAPTSFYGATLAIALLGLADPLNAYLALGYVALRIVHSLFQSLIDYVPLRFFIFTASWFVLGFMIFRALFMIVSGL